MTRIPLIAAAALALMAAPALADDSPAEIFGAQNATDSSSPATLNMAMEKFESESPAERLMRPDEIVTRGVTIGDRQLAASLGVNVENYSSAELSAMYIGLYD